MKEFYHYANENWGIKGIMTRVKVNNVGSNRLEDKLGANLVGTEGNYNFYHLIF